MKEMMKMMLWRLKMNSQKVFGFLMFTGMSVMSLGTSAYADGWDDVVEPVANLVNEFIGPALTLVVAVGTLYCIILGVKYAKAEEPQEREKAKTHLKNAIIGFVLIFVLMVILNLSLTPLKEWVKNSSKNSINLN